MSDLLLTVTGKHLELTNSTDVLAGEVNATNCVFAFDSAWDDCTKTVVFYSDPAHKKYIMLTSNTCPIPWEALLTTGTLQIGLFGVKAALLIPTNYVEHLITEGAHSETTPPPAEDVYLQIINIMQQQGVDAQTATDKADEAAQSAADALLSGAYAYNSEVNAKKSETNVKAREAAISILYNDIIGNYDTSALAPVVADHTALLALKANITDLASQFIFKGSCLFADLPVSDNAVNDTYFVTDLGYNCSWNGSEWHQSSSPTGTSSLTASDADNFYNGL